MKCIRCGTDASDNQKICTKCGSILSEDHFYDNKIKRFHYTTKIGLITVCVLFVLCGFIYTEFKNYSTLKKITPIHDLKIDTNSIHYINDLYISDSRHYTYLLDNYQKEIYENLLTAIKNYDDEITVDTVKMNSKYPGEYLLKVYDTIIMDHPEILHLGEFKTISTSTRNRVIGITYTIEKEQLQTTIDESKRIINMIHDEIKDKKELEKAKYIYEYLSKNNNYTDTTSINKSAYSALSGKYGSNYLAYSKASQILLQNNNVNSIMTIGSIGSNTYAWNLIEINKNYYYFDVTASSYNNEDLRFNGFLKNSRKYNYIYSELIPKIKNKY